MSKLTQALNEIIHWLKLNYPEDVLRFRQGLSINEIKKATHNFPFVLPKEVIELYQFCDGDIMLGPNDFVLYSLNSALKWSPHWEEGYKYPPNNDNHILTLMHGLGKDVYYVLCNREVKDYSPVWHAYAGYSSTSVQMYASSLTNLMLTIAECYREGAYYASFDEEVGYLTIEQNLEKVEKIFQKYNPEQIDAWREDWIG